MKRRILQIVPTLHGGGRKTIVVVVVRLAAAGEFDVHVCTVSQGGALIAELEQAGVPVTVIGKHWKFDPSAWWKLRKHIAALKPDLVQTWLFTANAYGRAAAISAGVRRIVASERCVDSWKAPHQLAVDRYLAKRTDAIIVNSLGVEEFYKQQGIPAAKLRLIYNGIGPAAPSDTTRADLLAELNLPTGTRLIGAVGRLWPQKRVKDLIWAADMLKIVSNDVHLLIVGDGPQRAALERYRRLCHIEDRVHFLGARHDVPRLMPHFDLLWLASGFEGLPNTIMEAMSVGIPVVASDIWGNRELVVHGETGYLVPTGDRASLARYAYKILQDPALAARLGAAGKQRIEAEFTILAMVDKHVALYRELMD